MEITIFNVDEFCKELPAISRQEELLRGDFHPEGLFSKQVFGPEVTATCGCNIYWGRNNIGKKCPICNVDITYSSERRKRFAKIELPFKIINPVMYLIISKVGKTTIKNMMDHMMFSDIYEGYYFHDERFTLIKNTDYEDPNFKLPDGSIVYKGLEGIFNLINYLCEKYKDNPKWDFIKNNMDKFYINNVIINPPDYRPASKSKDDQKIDELNKFYKQIINFCSIEKINYLDDNSEHINTYMVKYLHQHVFELYTYIFDSFSKKKGIIRKYILGKRIDFSGRAVITPDPTLKMEECSIPYLMTLELFKLDIIVLLLSKRIFKRVDLAFKEVEECIRLENYKYFDMISDWIKDKYVILNRQPTLHRLGIMSFKVKINKNYVIKIHPLICDPYNADFDGDQMAVYRPLYPEAEQECADKISIKHNLLSPTSGNMSVGLNQDIILGLYLLTSPDEKNVVEYKGKKTYKGRVEFNDILPAGYPFLDKTIDKKTLKILLNDIIKTRDPAESLIVLDKIKELGFKCTTKIGCTMSLKNMNTKVLKEVAKKIFDSSKDWKEKFKELKSPEVLKIVKENFPYSNFIDSGSRGSWDQATQLVLCRGYVANSKGKVIQEPIVGSLVDGLTKKEFFNSCYGSRKALLDVAINTGTSGYLTRRLVYAASNLEIDENVEDCGCGIAETLIVHIPMKEHEFIKPIALAKSFIGRFAYVGNSTELTQITYENYHTLIGKTLKLRSPIFCKNINLCKKCYGDTSNMTHSNYVGIIAAEALGEISTQLVLRTFHTCLRKNVEILDVNNQRIKSEDVYNKFHNNESIYTFSCSPDGYIEVSKVINVSKDRKEKQLVRITLDNNESFDVSLDHPFQMRDGTYKEARDLKEDNSLMPIYIDENRNESGYRVVRHNVERSRNQYGYHRKSCIFHLSSEHEDCKVSDNDIELCQLHHIDKNKKNDRPDNIIKIDIKEHISEHGKDGRRLFRTLMLEDETYRINHNKKMKDVVSNSNKNRMKDETFKKNFIDKVLITWTDDLRKNTGLKVKEWYNRNETEGLRVALKSRETMIRRIVEKIIQLNYPKYNIVYDEVRNNYFTERFPMFDYAKKVFPELVSDFVETNLESEFLNKNNHKVKKIEIITLDEEEELIDIEVDSEHHNFPLAAGVFVHNSGSVSGFSDTEDNQDIINDLSKVNKLFRCTTPHPYNKLLMELFKVYSEYSDILFVHFEIVVSQMMRKNNKRWRMSEDRNLADVDMCSIDIVPEKESYLLGVAFCKPKSYLIDAILDANEFVQDGILEKIMSNKEL